MWTEINIEDLVGVQLQLVFDGSDFFKLEDKDGTFYEFREHYHSSEGKTKHVFKWEKL